MRLKQLAHQTDPADFQRLYHDPGIHTSEIATRFGIRQSRVSEFAHLLGVETRREAGVMWKPTLTTGFGVEGRGFVDPTKVKRVVDPKPETPSPALGPCNPGCPEWRHCTDGRLWVSGPLPCETLLDFETE